MSEFSANSDDDYASPTDTEITRLREALKTAINRNEELTRSRNYQKDRAVKAKATCADLGSGIEHLKGEIALLREALEAAEQFVADELEMRMGGVHSDPDDKYADDGYVSVARDCLAKVRAALGKEHPR